MGLIVTSASLAASDITGKTADTSPAADDLVVTSDTSASGDLKKVTLENIFKVINGLTADTAPVLANDLVAIYSAADSAPRKMTIDNLFGGLRPAFYANRASTQSIASGGSYTKIQYNTEVFDDNSNYDPSTNFRFTPTVAGYYLIIVGFQFDGSADGTLVAGGIYKNASEYAIAAFQNSANTITGGVVPALVYMNGSTDYVEGFVFQSSGLSQNLSANGSRNFFMGMRLI